MNTRGTIPFLRLLLPFLTGILFAINANSPFPILLYTIPIYIAIIGLFLTIKKLNTSFNYSWVFGFIVSISLFLCGIEITNLNTEKYKDSHFGFHLKNSELYLIQTDEPYLEKDKTYKVVATIKAVKQNDHWVRTCGKAIFSFKKDSISKNIQYGDLLLTRTKFNTIDKPKNPEEFDYRQFLSYKNIYHQAYVDSKNKVLLHENRGNRILRAAYDLRNSLLRIYIQNNISGEEYAVASALILGYDDRIDKELINAYAGSGTLHILSVSGLHVGIIYLLINYLLFFIEKNKYGRSIKCLLILLTLWFYATLTGLSPSVLRSALMFSIIVIAQTTGRNTNIYNTLCFACFVLLMLNPFSIVDVGFQLSFLAVFGIVTIHPWLYEKYKPKNWFIQQLWMMTSVSLAAQIITFPLGIYYFHQFPNYFILANLIVIPLSTVVLIYGLTMFVLGSIPFLATICSKLFISLLWLLNQSVIYIEKLPGAVWQGISITGFETIILFSIIILCILFISTKHPYHLIVSLVLITIFLSIQITENLFNKNQRLFIVYHTAATSAYDYINGNSTMLICDSSILNDREKIKFHIQNNRWASNITQEKTLYTGIKNDFIQFGNKKIAVIKQNIHSVLSKERIKVDLIILSKNANTSIMELQKKFMFNKLIMDSSNKEWKVKMWIQECMALGIDYHSVLHSGAYIENIAK
mgnify:CR=1 FL=1